MYYVQSRFSGIDFQGFESQLKNSHRQCSVKEGVLKNFSNFTRKHLCWSLFLIKLQAWWSAILLQKDSNTGVFLWNLRNSENTYFEEHLGTAASDNSATSMNKYGINIVHPWGYFSWIVLGGYLNIYIGMAAIKLFYISKLKQCGFFDVCKEKLYGFFSICFS